MQEETGMSVTPTITDGVEEAPQKRLTVRSALTALRAAFEGGAIDKKQYKSMRADFGISQSSFTRKPFNRTKARAANKAAKLARKATRGSFKGQKMHKGMKR